MFRDGVDHGQQCAVLRLAQGYPTFLGLAVLIVKDGYLQRMQKYLASLLKTYAVLTNALLARPPVRKESENRIKSNA